MVATSGTYKNFKRCLCEWSAVSGGVGDFIVGTAQPGKSTPELMGVIDGNHYDYYSQLPDGSQWEAGNGAYDIATHKLHRTAIVANSNGTTAAVNFASPPLVGVLANPDSALETPVPIPSATVMLFQQAAAPAGWTTLTTHNDKALRVVDGSSGVSSGGSNSFSTVMAQTVVGNHTLSLGETAPHVHNVGRGGSSSLGVSFDITNVNPTSTASSDSQGGGGSHNHTILMSINYVDLILCSKN